MADKEEEKWLFFFGIIMIIITMVIPKELAVLLLSYCAEKGMSMLIAIVDRDTSVSYYTVERVMLEGSKNMYFEIGWFRP